MKLISVRVQNYKCIDDSEEFSVSDLTCLAGKNESGKTALLQALRRLNPVEESEGQFDSLMEYPRLRLHEYQAGTSGPASAALTTKWELSEDDIAVVKQVVGPCAIQNSALIIKKGYDNKTKWIFELDEAKVVRFLASEITELSGKAKENTLAHENLEELHSRLMSVENPTQGETELRQYIEDRFPNNDPHTSIATALHQRLPRFLYFPTYGTLPGRIQVEEFVRKAGNATDQTEKERLFAALLSLAGTGARELQEASRYEELKARLEAVSNRLSREIFEYWTQNRNLEVEFDQSEGKPNDPPPFNEGHVFNLRVRNSTHRVTVGFDERSAGFVWFFSFLVWFSQMEQVYGDKLIILLDEPGLSLHGKAQGDLLRYIKEKLLPKYQVIYTTHSPFMVDTENILNVRTVADVPTEYGTTSGTKVGDKVLSADADTIFPLRAALGYDITQSLFIGEHSLLVEGPSDLLFLRWASKRLIEQGRTSLDPRWTVTPVGGIDKLGSFAALFAGNKLHVAVLTDFHSGDKRKVREMKESEIFESVQVFSAERFANQEEADIEDMVGRDLYCELVNRCYQFEDAKMLPCIRPSGASPIVLEEVKQHFKTVATEGRDFDHLSPAVYLVEHASKFHDAKGIDTALNRFEEFFKAVNRLLPNVSV